MTKLLNLQKTEVEGFNQKKKEKKLRVLFQSPIVDRSLDAILLKILKRNTTYTPENGCVVFSTDLRMNGMCNIYLFYDLLVAQLKK